MNKKFSLSRRNLIKGALCGIGAGAVAFGMNGLVAFAASESHLPKPGGQMAMNRHPRTGVPVSALGYGCMRFPMLSTASSPRSDEIDEKEAFRLIDYALAHGVNYFDTAWFYHKGASEAVLGKALARHPRESFLVASKMPGRVIESLDQARDIFAMQLRKCQVDHFDFYQLHAVMSSPAYKKVYEDLGVLDFLLGQKEKGVIRHLGWSFHGDCEALAYLLSRPVEWDYAMLQLNYHDLMHDIVMQKHSKKNIGLSGQPAPADWTYAKVRGAGIPIVVMEPLLGGRLARLGKKASAPLREIRPEATPASWALRYVAGLPGVLTVLSGMTQMKYLQENLATFTPLEPISAAEEQALQKALSLFLTQESIGCTTCGYCMPCPYGVDIPAIFSHYNRCLDNEILPRDKMAANHEQLVAAYLADYDRHVPELRQAARCTGCGKCVAACPAMIDIPGELAKIGKFTEDLRNGAAV